jgi:hypothetical protein
MEELKIKVLDFTEYPGPRYIDQGEESGEQFYYDIIKPNFEECISSDKYLVVDLDDTAGYASSFLDECFGNLVYDFNYDEIIKRLKIISFQEPDWEEVIFEETLPEWLKKFKNNIDRKPSN